MVTETDWLAAKSEIALNLYRTAKQQYRKWRLFGVACTRRAMDLSPDPRLEPLAAAAADFADGLIDWPTLKKLRKEIFAVRKTLGEKFGPDEINHNILDALDRVTRQKPIDALAATQPAYFAFAARARPEFDRGLRDEEKRQVQVAHCIFGNPFRPQVFEPAWRTAAVLDLAESMYNSRSFVNMPILTDALQDAGCADDRMLTHCRSTGTHVRGCWVVDLVTNRK